MGSLAAGKPVLEGERLRPYTITLGAYGETSGITGHCAMLSAYSEFFVH